MYVTIIDSDGENYRIDFERYEYPNLMELIVNTYYSEIGECKGKGLCATCTVVPVNGYSYGNKSQLEIDTLSVNNINNQNYRLSCQILLDKTIDGAVFRVSNNMHL
ncbi:hypothetical protein [uncultured Algibacter sp.]|uniref:hypothetical protein n=1 Tax=uncultured Algibacter sp. TaxID=298659 RepID=UPI0032162790